MKRLKFGNTILCEYIATSSEGKHTLVNALSGDVIVKGVPGQIFVAFYLELLMPDGPPTNLELELKLGKNSLTKVKAQLEVSGPVDAGVIVLPTGILRVDGDTVIEIIATADGYSRTTAFKRKISAYVPPADQLQ